MKSLTRLPLLFAALVLGALGPRFTAKAAHDASLAEVVVGIGHANSVGSVAFAPDGKTVLSGSTDSTLKLWDVASGRLLRTLAGHSGTIKSVAFAPDGRTVVSGSEDNTLKLWDIATGRLLRTIVVHSLTGFPGVTSVAFAPDGNAVLSGSSDWNLELWDLASGQLLRTFQGDPSAIYSVVAFAPDGRTALSGSYDHALRLWDLASGRLLRTFRGHSGTINSVAFSQDGGTILSRSDDHTFKLWDAASGKVLRTFVWHSEEVASVAFAPDGRTIVSANNDPTPGSSDHTIKLWDVASGQLLRTFKQTEKVWRVNSVAFSPDGRTVVSAQDNGLKLWQVDTGRQLHAFGEPPSFVQSVALAPDGQIVISGHSGLNFSNPTLRFWDASSGRLLRNIAAFPLRDRSIAVAPDGRTVLSGSQDKKLALWNVTTGELLRSLDGFVPVAFAPDGRTALSGDNDSTGDSAIKLWDIASGQLLRKFVGHKESANSVAFAPDGRTALSGSYDHTLRLWDLASGRLLRTFHPSSVDSVAFAPSGQTILSGGYQTLQLWDVASGRLLHNFTDLSYGFIKSVAFSSDGRAVLAGNQDNTVRLWDTASGRLLRTFVGHTGIVRSVAFAPDGRTVLSGSDDSTIRFWSVTTGELLVTLVSFGGDEWATITPEGFFDATDQGARMLNVVRGLDIYSIDQFYQSLYRPDLVREKFAGDPRGLVREAAVNLDLNKVIASGNAPDVRLTLPGRSVGQGNLDANSVLAAAEITDRGGGIGRVEWRVNGVTSGIDTPAPAPSAGPPVRLTRSLALDPGDNTIEVVAYNSGNLIASVPVRVSVAAQIASPSIVPSQPAAPSAPSAPAPVAAVKPRLFVLVAGVNNYADQRFKLSYAVSDAKEVARGFGDAAGSLYQSVEVKLMTDAEVTRDKLDAAFVEMAGKTSASDVFVLYLAGHGKTVDGRYYFVPQDFTVEGERTEKAINAAVKAIAIAQDQLQRWFALIPARKSVILFDTCDSGTLAGDQTQQLEKGAANNRLAQATGRSILAASGGSQEALEGYRGHGLFTYEILDAIDQADGDRSGTVELNELAAYVYAQVSELSQKVFGQRQVPEMKITANFTLAKQTHILQDEVTPIAEAKPTYQLAQTAQLQIQPNLGATVVRSLSAKTPVTVLESHNGWSLVASDGKPLGYVATRDLAPVQ
jgi:WD40 repeat protein/uncharacterized caspase-like protein